jgi:hypothetical protein
MDDVHCFVLEKIKQDFSMFIHILHIFSKLGVLRYVMLGNHRDAWGFGALDPSSGTAQLMEVVRLVFFLSLYRDV